MERLSVYDFRDLDLMVQVRDLMNGDGVTSQDVREALGMPEESQSAVGSRLAWMRRFGIFTKDEKTGTYRLSAGGERVIESKVKAAAQHRLEAVPDEAMVEVMAHVTSRYRLGDPLMATLLRREFVYGTARGR